MAKPSPSYSGDNKLVAIGNAIRTYRIGIGLSQEALALSAGLDRSYVGGIERGEHNLAIINLVKICAALDLRTSELLRRSDL
jgi:transcriptional regulator with XRE-family HTH domain